MQKWLLSAEEQTYGDQDMNGSNGSKALVTANYQPRILDPQESRSRFHTVPVTQANRAYMPSVRLTPTPNDCWLWL